MDPDATATDDIARRPLVGAKIRRLRLSQGKTLRQVADDLGVARSALSMLENDQAGVSLQRLQRIARYLGVTIIDLLAEPAPSDATRSPEIEVVRRAIASTPGVGRGKGVIYQLPAASSAHLLQAAIVSFQPDGGYERDQIGHTGEEMVYVLSGDVQLHIGEQVIELSEGDLAVFRTETPHAFRNASSAGPAIVLTVATPPW